MILQVPPQQRVDGGYASVLATLACAVKHGEFRTRLSRQ